MQHIKFSDHKHKSILHGKTDKELHAQLPTAYCLMSAANADDWSPFIMGAVFIYLRYS